jgi:hypothetical protein
MFISQNAFQNLTSRISSKAAIIRIFLAVLAFSIPAAPGLSGAYQATQVQEVQEDAVHRLWSSTIEPSLRRQVTENNQAQTMAVTLMVPLHAAFQHRDERWIQGFAAQFSQFASDPSALPSGEVAEISRLYYFYLASQFVVLAKSSGRQDLIPQNLPDLIYSELHSFWLVTPAWQFDQKPFPGAGRERLLWKLKNRRVRKSYYRAVLDHDLYVFAIAADLKAFEGNADQQEAWSPLLDDILSITHQVFTQEVAYQPDGGWVFQPGVWTDHPEYQYAGNQQAVSGIKPAPVRGIAPDSSHSLRFPLWLTSLMNAYPSGSDERRFYENLRSGLEKQFFNKVLHQPAPDLPCFLIANFMDGSNGVYRWSYQTLGKENGYGPYQNSASFLLGWWVFLDTERIRTVYKEVAAQFPWPRQCVELYLRPHPSDVPRSESAYDPASSELRTMHICSLLAASL